jgi:hypothetical protein
VSRRALSLLVALGILITSCARHDFNLSAECPRFGETLEESEVSGAITLMAQSVPDATMYPCVERLRPGWEVEQIDVERNRSTIALSSDRLGDQFLRVYLQPACAIAPDATIYPTQPDEAGTTLYEDIHKTLAGPDEEGEYEGSWWYEFEGGCVEFEFDAEGPGVDEIADDARQAFTFRPTGPVLELVAREFGVDR